jgi:hypothetical protein
MASLSTPTLDELLTEARFMLNQPDPTNSNWSDDELASYLNEGTRRYFSEAVLYLEGQFTTTGDLDITANAETIPLPSDFFKVKALYRKVSGGFEPLPYRNNLTESYSTEGGSGGDGYMPYYYLRGNSLVLRPVPNFTEVAGLKIEYVQLPETMLTGGDSLTSGVSPVFRDLVVTYAVYKAKLKESLVSGNNNTQLIRENVNDLFTAFKDLIATRSGSPTAIIPFNPED